MPAKRTPVVKAGGRPKADWRSETKRCLHCGETFWPHANSKRPEWRKREFCQPLCKIHWNRRQRNPIDARYPGLVPAARRTMQP